MIIAQSYYFLWDHEIKISNIIHSVFINHFQHFFLLIAYLGPWQLSWNCLVAKSCPTLWNPMNCSTPGSPVLQCLPEFAQAHVHLSQWCHPTISSSVAPFSSCPQSFCFSVFSNDSVLCIKWPKYWSFSFIIRPSSEFSGLISFTIDWFDLFAVQGTLKSLLQHHSSRLPILLHSAFFMVQLSYPHMTTGKTIALTIQTFVSKVMSLLLNTLSRIVIAFLPRS